MAELDLATISNIATALAVIVALTVGLVQINQFQRKRQEAAAIELVNSYLTPEFMHAVRAIYSLPENVRAQEIRDRHLEDEADTVFFVFEALGLMVHERIVSLKILDKLVGARTRVCWSRLKPWIEEVRSGGRATYAEWFQWLAERLEENTRPGRFDGAHVTYRDWRP